MKGPKMKKNSKNSSVSSAAVVSTPAVNSSAVSIDSFPAIPAMFNRLMRLNYGISTLEAKRVEIERAITAAPINLQAMQDDLKISQYIALQAQFGVEMPRSEAMKLLGLIRSNSSVNLTGDKIPVNKITVRSSETLELKANDKEILALYSRYGFMTHTEFVQRIQADGTAVSSAVLARYAGIAKQIAYLQGKQSNNGYLKDIQLDCTPIELLQQLSAHEKYQSDASTFALTKRAVRIWAALNN